LYDLATCAYTLNCGLDPPSNLLAKGLSCTTVLNDTEHRLCNNPGKVYHKRKVDDKVVKQVISRMFEPQNSTRKYKNKDDFGDERWKKL
jgi:hypothetical protein